MEQKAEGSGNGDQPDGVQLFTPAADKKDDQYNQHGAPADGRHTAEIEQRARADTAQSDGCEDGKSSGGNQTDDCGTQPLQSRFDIFVILEMSKKFGDDQDN